jgi:hypothetical protein
MNANVNFYQLDKQVRQFQQFKRYFVQHGEPPSGPVSWEDVFLGWAYFPEYFWAFCKRMPGNVWYGLGYEHIVGIGVSIWAGVFIFIVIPELIKTFKGDNDGDPSDGYCKCHLHTTPSKTEFPSSKDDVSSDIDSDIFDGI